MSDKKEVVKLRGFVATVLIAMASAIASTDTMPVTAAPAVIPHTADSNEISNAATTAMVAAGIGLMAAILRRRKSSGYHL